MKGYKIGLSKVDDNGDSRLCYALIELEIPENYPGLKCYSFGSMNRSNVARVLNINKLVVAWGPFYEPTARVTLEYLDSAFSLFDPNFYYHPGELVYPDRFEDKMFMCANGIHFFTNRQQAIDYTMNNWVLSRFTDCTLELLINELNSNKRY